MLNRVMGKVARRARMMTACAVSLVAGGAASAGEFAVLDWVPADAAVVVAIDKPSALSEQVRGLVQGLAGAGGDMGDQFAALDALLSTPGFDAGKPVALVVLPSVTSELGRALKLQAAGEDAEPDEAVMKAGAFVVFGAEDYAELTGSIGAVTEDGIQVTGELGGEPAFMRDLGDGLAAMGADAAALKGLALRKGQLRGHAERVGAAGQRLLKDSDVVVIADVGAIGANIDTTLGMLREQIDSQMMMMGLPGGEGMGPMLDAYQGVVSATMTQGKTMMAGVRLADEGIVIDLASQFKPGTELAGLFASGGSSTAHLERLPDRPFLFAYSVDYAGGGLNKLMGNALELAAATPGAASMKGLIESMRSSTGTAQVMAVSPTAQLGFGYLSDWVQYVATKDAGAARGAYETALTELNGQEAEGVAYTSSFGRDAATVGGKKADTYSFAARVEVPAGGFMDPNQINSVLFGPAGGPAGFVLTREDALIMTGSQNPELAEAAAKAAAGEGGLTGNAMLARSAAMLPAGRSMEAYFAAGEVVNMVRPMLSAFAGVNMDPIESMPPVAMSGSVEAGAVTFRVFVPNEFMSMTQKLGETFGGMMPGMMGEPGMAPEEPGAPRF